MPTTLNDPNAENIMGCRPSRGTRKSSICAPGSTPTLTFTCVEMRDAEHAARYKCSPEGLLSQVLREAHEAGVVVNGENALARFGRRSLRTNFTHLRRGGEDRRAILASASNFSRESRNSMSSDDSMMHSHPSSPVSEDRAEHGIVHVPSRSDELFEPDNFTRFATFVRQMSV